VGCFGGSSPFTLTLFPWDSSSFTLANSCALGWSMETNGGGREPLLDGCEELLIIPGGNGCLCA
jgi:hypothetical protein